MLLSPLRTQHSPFRTPNSALSILLSVAISFFSFASHKKSTRVVFFGDSITEFGVQADGYIAQMRDSLDARKMTHQYELIGAGIGGNKIYDLYLRMESDVLERKPKVVVIYVGVNDVWHKLTFGTGTDADKFKKFYAAIIAKLKKEDIKVILCTPACVGEKKGGVNPLDVELDIYSQIIRDLAREKDCLLSDFRKAFVEFNAINNTADDYSNILTTDGVHLNQKGNKLVAEMLLERLQLLQ